MKRLILFCFLFIPCAVTYAQSFTLESVRSHPFPSDLTASAQGSRLAWVFNEQGKRNVYVAEGPDFAPRKLTNYREDDGQEISSLAISADGKWVVYVRGGDHGSNWDEALPVNPLSAPTPIKVQVWCIPFGGGEPRAVSEGDEPVISPKNDQVAFLQGGQIWAAPLDGSTAARQLFTARGANGSVQWSPDGSKLAFVSNRRDHAFIGIFTNAQTPITWLAPSFFRDQSPRWSTDGTKIVFVRTPGAGGPPDSLLTPKHQPWGLWTVDVAGGKARPIWQAPQTLAGSVPSTNGGFNLHWAAKDRLIFMSYQDGWPHLYSVPASGGTPLLLTPGPFMAEHIRLSPDRQWLVFSANTGPDPLDLDRRHVVRVPVDKAAVEVLTPGDGLEWTPVVTGDGSTLALISATAQRPPLPAVMPFTKGKPRLLGQNLLAATFPTHQLVTPKQVIFKAADGVTVHGQLFEPAGGAGRKPAIIYVHGGPSRQMLLGWHYSDYYANAYAWNQYLTSLGFAVLSVNYRLGIGYGYGFHQVADGGENGAAEYRDIRAAGEWLARQPRIDAGRIGVYGGSYGGYLTALALARDSKLFAAGVDIHGEHNLTVYRPGIRSNQVEQVPDADQAAKITWESSPVSAIQTWTSPVLVIHGDDDRNVGFSQSADLVRRLEAKGVPMETLVIPDDTHHWMRHANALKVGHATVDFFKRKLLKREK